MIQAALVSIVMAAAGHPQAAQPVPTPVAPAHAVAAAKETPWLERALCERLTDEYGALLTELKWSDEDRTWFTTRVIPAYCNNYKAVPLSDEALKRVAAYREKAEASGGDALTRDGLRLAYEALQTAIREADVRQQRLTIYHERAAGLQSPLLKPGLVRLSVCLHQTWSDPETPKSAGADVIAQALATAAAEPGLQGENVRLIAAVLDSLDLGNCESALILNASRIYAERPDADKWLAAYFTGVANIVAAWEIRGGGFISEVTEKEYQGFQEQLIWAIRSLKYAHELKPQWPEAAAQMVSVAMCSNNVTHGTPLEWYERAAKADPDPISAAKHLAWAATPRWKGEPKWSWRLMKDAAAGNYCGAFPEVAITAFLYAGDDRTENLEHVLAAPATYDLLTGAMRSYLAAPNPGMSPDLAREWLLLLAYHAGKPADATAVLAMPGFTPRPTFTVADAHTSSIQWWAAVAQSAEQKEIAAAEANLRNGRSSKALKTLTDIAPKIEAGDTAILIASRAALCKSLEQAVKPEAANLAAVEQVLPPLAGQSALRAWLMRGGENLTIERNGDRDALVFGPLKYAMDPARCYLPSPLKQFPAGYEISFDLTIKPGDEDVANTLKIYFNNQGADDYEGDDRSSSSPYIIISARDASFSNGFSERPPRKWTPAEMSKLVLKRSIRLVTSGLVAELYSDGELVDWSAGPVDREQPIERWLSISGRSSVGGEVRIENLSIKAIKEPLQPRARRERYTPKKPSKNR
ncbi:MAG: hypothetical protein QM783_11190 [Phycisphaerales bacterium]